MCQLLPMLFREIEKKYFRDPERLKHQFSIVTLVEGFLVMVTNLQYLKITTQIFEY